MTSDKRESLTRRRIGGSNKRGMMMTTYQDFAAEVKEIEQRLAPGSETSVLAHLNNKMHQLAGARWRESEAVMDEGEAQWWRDAYAAYSANEQLPADERETDLQALFDRV